MPFSALIRPFSTPRTTHNPSQIWRIVVVVVVCPLRLWWSYRSARLSAAEEDAREDLEYYPAEDDESEQTCSPETMTVSLVFSACPQVKDPGWGEGGERGARVAYRARLGR